MDGQSITSPKGVTYKILKTLGSGQFGKVYQVADSSGNQYAMKSVNWEELKMSDQMVKLFKNEQQVMEVTDHPHILKLYDKIFDGNFIHLITTFCDGGNLEELILNQQKEGIGEKAATNYLIQIAEGFKEMRKQQVIHRDLKLANIFLKNGEVVIGDFGFAKIGVSLTGTKLGTPYYMAPEILDESNKNKYTSKCDLWSIGICYYFLLFGQMPFSDAKTPKELLSLAYQYSGSKLRFKKDVSFNVKNLLMRLIEWDSEKRMSFDEFFNHPLIDIVDGNNPRLKNHKMMSDPNMRKGKGTNPFINTNNSNITVDNKGSNAQNYFSVSTVNSHITDFDLSHSNIEISQTGQSNINESNIPPSLKAYLYNKNIIIFLMDTAKKLKTCENQKNLESLFLHFLIVEMIVLKKAINYTNYIKTAMQQGNNIFSLDNFQSVAQTNDYQVIMTFFTDFEKFVFQLYNKLKNDIGLHANQAEQMIKKIDNFSNEHCNKEIQTSLLHILKNYKENRESLSNEERNMIMQAVIYLFFNNNISGKFPEAQFSKTSEWINFCQMLNNKPYNEIEGKMFQFYKVA